MALYITFKNCYGPREKIWHVGENKPSKRDNDEIIMAIQADGDELVHIGNNFDGIPFADHKRVVTWRGQFAEFIFDNL